MLLFVLLVSLLLIGLVPLPNDAFLSSPSPVADYDDAVTRIAALQTVELPITSAASRSIFLAHGEKTENVYVLIHGLGNAPREFAELAQMLHGQGDNVIVMRMPYHGLQGMDMHALDALTTELVRDYADDIVDLAHGLGENVTVIGISGGGAVGAWIAQNRPNVSRVALISPFLGIKHVPTLLDPLVKNVLSRLPKFSINGAIEADREWLYRGISSNGVAVYMTLGQSVLHSAENHPPAVSDVLILTTEIDAFVDNRWAQRLAETWQGGGANVQTHEFAASQGVPHASVDPFTAASKRQLVYDLLLAWLERERR